MKVSGHVKVSAVLGILFYAVTRSFFGGVACFFAGVLIDTDHLIDYFVNYKIPIRNLFNLEFLRGLLLDSPVFMGQRLRGWRKDWDEPLRSLVVFHSIELVFIVLAIFYYAGYKVMGLSIAVGLAGHLVSDYATWGRRVWAFSFVYRASIFFNMDEDYCFKQRLKNKGIDITHCSDCGHESRTEVHWEGVGPGYKTAPIEEFEVLCPECHDKRHDRCAY